MEWECGRVAEECRTECPLTLLPHYWHNVKRNLAIPHRHTIDFPSLSGGVPVPGTTKIINLSDEDAEGSVEEIPAR